MPDFKGRVMNDPKYKKGQIVRVRPDLDVESLREVGPRFTVEMDRCLGKKTKVLYVEHMGNEYWYTLGAYSYSEDWLMPEVMNEVIIVEEE